MGDVGYNYSKRRPKKYHVKELATKKIFSRQKENNAIVKNVVDYIILQDNKKITVEYESHENINSEVDNRYLYGIDNISLDEK